MLHRLTSLRGQRIDTGGETHAVNEVWFDDDGEVGVTAGKFLSRDTYADVTLDEEGEAEVSITVDLTDDLTVRGSVNDRGETGFGLFFERDY